MTSNSDSTNSYKSEQTLHLQLDKQCNIVADNRKDIEPSLQDNNIDSDTLNTSIENLVCYIKDNYASNQQSTMNFYDCQSGLSYSIFMYSACFSVSASLSNIKNAKHLDLSVLIEQLPNALFWKDANSTFVGCNKLFANSAGFKTPEDIIGKTDFAMPWGGANADKYIADDREIITSMRAKLNYEEKQTLETGEEIDVLVSKAPVKLYDGSTGVLGVYTDITARKQHEQALAIAKTKAERSDREKSQFLAIVSHELRTPLSAIKGGIDLIKPSIPQSHHETIDNIAKASNHLLQLVEDVIDLVKSSESKLKIKHDHIDIADIINECYELSKHKYKAKSGVKLTKTTHLEVNSGLQGDATRIKQVIVNLLDNAIKFTDNGTVEIIATTKKIEAKDQASFSVTIKDTGCGIDEDKQKFVFDRFTQIPQGPEYYSSGFGLGLSICKYLASSMGGSIKLMSELGKGSEFTLSVPLKISKIQKKHENNTLSVDINNAQKKKKFLLVEDNQLNRTVVTSLLNSLGAKVDCAASGAEAEKKLSTTSYDLILMDIGLPDTNGVELTKIIRKQYKNLTIYALTAHALATDDSEMQEVFDDIIVKPVGIEDLANIIG